MTADFSVDDFHPTAADSNQPFETQNQLFSSILGDPSVKIFKTQTLTPVLNNLSIKEGALYPYKVILILAKKLLLITLSLLLRMIRYTAISMHLPAVL